MSVPRLAHITKNSTESKDLQRGEMSFSSFLVSFMFSEESTGARHKSRSLLVSSGDEFDRHPNQASMISTFSSAGTPKMYSTLSFSTHLTNSSAGFIDRSISTQKRFVA